MSFSGSVKRELAHVQPVCRNCRRAMLCGMFLVSRTGKNSLVLTHTEHKPVADSYLTLLTELSGIRATVSVGGDVGPSGKKSYQVAVGSREDVLALSQFLGAGPDGRLSVRNCALERECCVNAFFRGAFMACGSVTDPEKEYHLELAVGDARTAEEIAALAGEYGISFRRTSRKGASVLYLKESEPIEEFLTRMGAVNGTLELMNVKIFKDVRNKVNRVTNCETANIEKTVNAASVQVGQIELIERKIGIDELPEELQELARLRLENPEMSLRELGAALSEPISRSGVNHRLKRLATIAEELKTKGKTGADHV